MRTIELFRHTDNDADRLTPEGVAAAVAIGHRLSGEYVLAASSGAQRATQTIGCLLAASDCTVVGGVVIVDGLRSTVEDRWRRAYEDAGAGDLASLRDADPELVEADGAVLAEGLRTIFAMLPDGGRALAVGHSPTNEAAIHGLTGTIVPSLGKGEHVVVVQDDDGQHHCDDPRS